MKKISYVEFEKENGKIIGNYYYVTRSKFYLENNGIFGKDAINEYIENAPDTIKEIFFYYDFKDELGYYIYPGNQKEIQIKLNKISYLTSITTLQKLIDYNKEIKLVNYIIKKLNDDYKLPIIIDGDSFENISINDENIVIKEGFLINLYDNMEKYDSRVITGELQILNNVLDLEKFKISSPTRKFLSEYIDKLLDIGVQAEKYKYVIDKFKNLLSKPDTTEKEWQKFIHEYYRYFFPEYINITRERKIKGLEQEVKYVDFLLNNQTSTLLLEIKRPNQQIMSKSKDRNNHFFVSSINKAILQIHRYLYAFKNEMFNNRKEISVKAILLVGYFDNSEDEKTKNDFKMARSIYKDIEIMTYYELLNKIENIYDLLINS